MTAGLLRAADLAAKWAATGEHQAGKRGERVRARLKNLLTDEDYGAIASVFGANSLRALQSALMNEAAIEDTDPEALVLHECPNCGHHVPIAWTPPEK